MYIPVFYTCIFLFYDSHQDFNEETENGFILYCFIIILLRFNMAVYFFSS